MILIERFKIKRLLIGMAVALCNGREGKNKKCTIFI
jgi:hypothetical protein